MSKNVIESIGRYYKLTEKQKTFVALINDLAAAQKKSDHARIEELNLKLAKYTKEKDQYITLSREDLEHMEGWYCFPLLRLIGLCKNGISLREIIDAFAGKVPEKEIVKSLSAYEKINKIVLRDGRYFSCQPKFYYKTSYDLPSQTGRNAHKELLKRAIIALDEQSLLDREFISITLPVDPDKLPLFKKRIREALVSLSDEFIGESKEKRSIYQMSLQFFRQVEKIPGSF